MKQTKPLAVLWLVGVFGHLVGALLGRGCVSSDGVPVQPCLPAMALLPVSSLWFVDI